MPWDDSGDLAFVEMGAGDQLVTNPVVGTLPFPQVIDSIQRSSAESPEGILRRI